MISATCNMLSTLESPAKHTNVVTWNDVRDASANDDEIQELLALVRTEFSTDARKLSNNLRPYFPYNSSIYELDGVAMLGERIIVPTNLRPAILNLLHAAHQGVDRMKARAADTVYWPNLTGDITRTRSACFSCHNIAKSNPAQPPTPPREPEYPFQALAADYFHYRGHYYAVIVDRYSHWPLVYRAEDTQKGAKGLIKHLREIFSTYGVPEEISSDQGTEFTSKETQEFLANWQVRHRVSSTAFPHSNSNCRAELGVKQVKRMITDNTSEFGSLDVDRFHRAIMSYRNTIDPTARCSPALTVFGRQVRDGLPILPGKYNPHNTWQELLHHRELAMAKRHVSHHETWTEHTKKLAELQRGDKVFIQNQVGPNPRKWERTGTVVECKDHDQYTVKVDGTGRVTLRNRKFLRKLKLMPKPPSSSVSPASDPVITTSPTCGPETGTDRDAVPVTQLPTDHTPSAMPA